LGRPSGADHEEQQPGLVGLDAAIMCSGYADEYDCQAGRVSGNLGRERIARSLTGEVFAVFAESASDIDSAPAR
jgi:hypothetical protein